MLSARFPSRGACARGRAARGKQVARMFQLPARSSAELSQKPFSPPAPKETRALCGPPSGLMQSWPLAKSGKQSRRKRGRGSGPTAGFSGQVGSASRGPASRGCRPPARQLRLQTSPPAPGPALPPPAPSAPAAQPSALPSGPAYLREAACPGEECSRGAEVRTKRPSPSPLARTLRPPPRAACFRAPSRTGGHPTPGRLGKSLHRHAVPRRRTAPGSAEQPGPALVPARSFGAGTPGRWRSQPPRLVLGAGTRLLSPH